MCARMASRPKHVTVWYRGIPYRLDLVRCRRALVERQVEGELDSMESLAKAVGISRSTASRFFSGRPTSLAVTLKILGVLRLTFEDVATPEDDQDGQGVPELESLGLSVLALNCLKANGITTVAELLALNEEQLLGLRNLGRKSLAEIRQKLVENGLVSPGE